MNPNDCFTTTSKPIGYFKETIWMDRPFNKSNLTPHWIKPCLISLLAKSIKCTSQESKPVHYPYSRPRTITHKTMSIIPRHMPVDVMQDPRPAWASDRQAKQIASGPKMIPAKKKPTTPQSTDATAKQSVPQTNDETAKPTEPPRDRLCLGSINCAC